MKIETEVFCLETSYPFKISRSERKVFTNFIIYLTDGNVTGTGEAAPQTYYGESERSVRSALQKVQGKLNGEPGELRKDIYGGRLGGMLSGDASVRAALDMALWDLEGKIEKLPVYALLELDPLKTPQTSITIGFDSPDRIRKKIGSAAAFSILKLKMGLPGDFDLLDIVLSESKKKVRVDANEGWNLSSAKRAVRELHSRGVEFVEQPISHENMEDLKILKADSKIPIILDESIITVEDVCRCSEQGHGINIKLMKCGGITPALKLIEKARVLGLKVMLGCMIETSVGITAAAQISPLADYADLDGNLLLADDPFTGAQVENGRLILPSEPGLGVKKNKS